MADITVKGRVKNLNKTLSEWITLNPVLLDGEIGFISDENKLVIGDGVKTFVNLPQHSFDNGGGGGGSADVFYGTTADWTALTDEQKAQYRYVIFDDDGTNVSIVDVAAEGNMNGITSNAVYGIQQRILLDIGEVETAIAQNTSDISDLQDDKQDKTLETTLTIDGTEQTTVEGAIGAINSMLGTAAKKNSTNSVTSGSTDLVESGAVKNAIDSAIASTYKPSGDKTVSQLVSGLLIAGNLGNVYNITDSGTTTSDFIGGAGKPIHAGDNVGIVDVGTAQSPSYKFDLMSGFIDLSNYVQKSQTAGLMKNDGTIDTNSYVSDVSGKADKVSSATNGNFAGLNASGNLTDSGKKASDFASTDLATTSKNGLLKQLSGSTSQYLRGDGNWGTPPDNDTHHASYTYVSSSASGTSNTSSIANGSVRLNHVENGAVRSTHLITGSGGTTVTASNGTITIKSPSMSVSGTTLTIIP